MYGQPTSQPTYQMPGTQNSAFMGQKNPYANFYAGETSYGPMNNPMGVSPMQNANQNASFMQNMNSGGYEPLVGNPYSPTQGQGFNLKNMMRRNRPNW
jgi:hypothetical protein